MISPTTLARVRAATCAIGWLEGTVQELASDPMQPRFRIRGTGFLVRQDTILTARHVISKTVQERDARGLPEHPLIAGFYVTDPASVTIRIHAWGFAYWLNPRSKT
jgi:hypothetical protein